MHSHYMRYKFLKMQNMLIGISFIFVVAVVCVVFTSSVRGFSRIIFLLLFADMEENRFDDNDEIYICDKENFIAK